MYLGGMQVYCMLWCQGWAGNLQSAFTFVLSLWLSATKVPVFLLQDSFIVCST